MVCVFKMLIGKVCLILLGWVASRGGHFVDYFGLKVVLYSTEPFTLAETYIAAVLQRGSYHARRSAAASTASARTCVNRGSG